MFSHRVIARERLQPEQTGGQQSVGKKVLQVGKVGGSWRFWEKYCV